MPKNVHFMHIESQPACAPLDGGGSDGGGLPDNPATRMHVHLRAWRKFRGMSLKQVADALQKSHTTVARWEQGTVPLTLADLERLASQYGCTPSQLASDPANAGLIARLDRTQKIVETMDEETLQHWLSIGESLSKK
jgi:transcriptional regulator with XRE-family HTH domain